MNRYRASIAKPLGVLSLLLLPATVPGPAWAAGDSVVDGLPTATACAELGFAVATRDDSSGSGASFSLSVTPPPGVAPQPSPLAPNTAPRAAPSLNNSLPGAFAPSPQVGFLAEAPIDTERYPNATSNPIKQVASEPVSTFSIDVDTASYANVRRFLNDGTLPPRDAVRVEEMINYFDYGYLQPSTGEGPFAVHTAVTPSPWWAGREIVHIGIQGYDLDRTAQPPLNLVFLVDVSGSMRGEDRLGLIQKALNLLIDQLRPEDRVALVVYAGAAGAVLGPTPGNQKLKLRCAVDALTAGGSTAGGAGLALAYDLAQESLDTEAVNRVILLTDGDFNVGIADPEKLEDFVAEKRKTGVYLSVYGFGRGNYNDVMMQTLAQSGNGTAAYIDTLQEARKRFRDDFSGTLYPIADDVKIQVEFNPARVAEYRLIGYETRLLDRSDFNNDLVDAGEVGAGASVTALYEITPVGGPLSVDPLRYATPTVTGDPDGELAYLKIRYKLPGEDSSLLIERSIGDGDRPAALNEAPEATRWALAVAAYGQRLRGDPYVAADFDWPAILALAQGARGDDPFGLRAEFVQLVRAAETARSVNE